MDLIGRVHAYARQHQLWTPEMEVIVAVSGGADSVACLLILHELSARGCLRLGGVAHLNHHIREADADEDARFVGALATRLGLPFHLGEEDVPARARRHRQSPEVAARQARLEFFERLATGSGERRVALGHTRTDQAETVVLRLARGAGPRGLAGMAPVTGHRIRPLLEESRPTLRAWLGEKGQTWCEDASNADKTIGRNLVRLEILPRLAQLNPGAEAALARSARIQRSDAALLERLAAGEAAGLLEDVEGAVTFSMSAIRNLDEALARRVVRVALLRVQPGRTPGWDHTEAVLRCRVRRLDLGPVRLELFGDLAVLSNRARVGDRRAPGQSPAVALTIPGSAGHPQGRWTVDARGPLPRTEAHFPQEAGTPPINEAARVVVDATAVGRHLTIRSWEPGDRVEPLGLGGRKKLQDVFVDRKVPIEERAQVPVVVASDGRIVWVAGHVLGEPFRVTPHSEAVVVLSLRR